MLAWFHEIDCPVHSQSNQRATGRKSLTAVRRNCSARQVSELVRELREPDFGDELSTKRQFKSCGGQIGGFLLKVGNGQRVAVQPAISKLQSDATLREA